MKEWVSDVLLRTVLSVSKCMTLENLLAQISLLSLFLFRLEGRMVCWQLSARSARLGSRASIQLPVHVWRKHSVVARMVAARSFVVFVILVVRCVNVDRVEEK